MRPFPIGASPGPEGANKCTKLSTLFAKKTSNVDELGKKTNTVTRIFSEDKQ